MKLRFVCSLLTIIVFEFVLCDEQTKGNTECTQIRRVNVPITRLVTQRCRKGSSEICSVIKKKYVTENRTVCCGGWTYSVANRKCIPICKGGCKGGTCVAPDTCECDPPLILKHKNSCEEPICNSPCVNAKCVSDDKCSCNEGFEEYNATHCAPLCRDGFVNDPNALECTPKCDKCVNGNCTAPNTCICNEGYILENSTCIPKCSQSCKNGKCIAPDTCECSAGYSIDPSDKSVCNPICENTCVNATCLEPNKCACLEGYEHLSPSVCKPKCDNCNHGECVAPNTCNCSDGYFKADGITCTPVCSKTCLNGYCSAPNICACNKGYELDSEDKFKCQPICKDSCINATCSSPDTCTCYPGFEKLNHSVCRPLCSSCEHGVCLFPDNCRCNHGFSRINGTCEPVCSPPCINGFCESPDKCACNDGYLKYLTESVCHKPCIGDCDNGICYIDGKCLCNPGFRLFNNSCVVPDYCNKCNVTCVTDNCQCDDGRPCEPSIDLPPEAAQSTSLAGLQITWVLGGCVGILLVTIVIVTIGYMWRKRKEYGDKPTDNGNGYPSVLYTIPNTLIQKKYEENRDDSINYKDDEDMKKDVSLHLLEAAEDEYENRTL